MAFVSTSVLVVEHIPHNGCYQCLCPQSELQLLPVSLGGSPRSAGGSDPGTFQITASSLGLGACEILCVPLKSGLSISYSPLALPKVSTTGFQSQTFWGLIFLVQDPQARSWGAQCGVDLSLLGENLCNCNYAPICGS